MGNAAPVEEARKAQQQQQWEQDVEGNGGEHKRRPQLEEAFKCPRCESSNTKFCYYNNYSLSQSRFFCKACCRYWTEGGTLRNVPVGGGCRKHKRSSSSSTAMPPSSSSIAEVISSQQSRYLGPAFSTGFPNVLPTFTSSGGFKIPNFSMPLVPPLSLSSRAPTPAPVMAPVAATPTKSSFLDMLRSGLLDNQGNDLYGPMITDNINEMDVLLPMSSNFGIMQQHELVGDNHNVNVTEGGGQWPASQHRPNNGGSSAAGSEGGQ